MLSDRHVPLGRFHYRMAERVLRDYPARVRTLKEAVSVWMTAYRMLFPSADVE